MTVFDELNRFLEDRLEEFLQENPHLELLALDEQLQEQQLNAQRSLTQLQSQETHIQNQILETAREVERWHHRVQKAEAAGRMDLAGPARDREAALFRQGNQLWGQMQGTQTQMQTLQDTLKHLNDRRAEVKQRIQTLRQQQAQQATVPPGYSASNPWSTSPPPPKQQIL
ncbi:MAG: hypothetical protein RLZZ435_3885 [Cyanobacteriota bacterium]|jgi:uncharacterized protein (TIGR04376 family)